MTKAISRFLVVDTGVEFLYDNRNNTIYDSNLTPIILDKEGNKNLRNSGSLRKSKRPLHLRIAMGKMCNMSCSYCLQEDLAGLKNILDPNIDKFLEDLQKLNLEGLERVELWGGETFAYWPTMKRILKTLDREGLIWYLPTNGTLLRGSHINYLKRLKGKIAIGVSHDGPLTSSVRGKDPFPRLGSVLKKINDETDISYSLNATLSNRNYDVMQVFQGFWAIKNEFNLTRMGMEFDKVESYDFMSYGETIHGAILEFYRKSLEKFLTTEHDNRNTSLVRDVRRFAESIKNTSQTALQSRCGADWKELISVDINGDILSCPMVGSEGHKCGTLDKIEEAKGAKLNFKRKHNGNGESCMNCPVLLLCNKGCPLKLADIFRSRSCALLKVHNLEIQLAAFRLLFQSDIKYLE